MEPIKKFRFDRGKAKCPDTPRSSGVATPREMFGRRGSGEFTNRSSFNPVSNTGNMTDRQQVSSTLVGACAVTVCSATPYRQRG